MGAKNSSSKVRGAEESRVTARETFQSEMRHGLVIKPIVLTCSHCGKSIGSDMQWRCGYCSYDNVRTSLYSFLYKCQKCDREPKSYLCPHCDKVNALDAGNDNTHPARRATKAQKAEPQIDPRQEKRKRHLESKEDFEQKIEIAQLKAKLAVAEAASEGTKTSTPQEDIKKALEQYLARVMGGHLAVDECRRELSERYKDKPELLKDLNDALTCFLEEHFK